jgi:peroxiredoxin
MKASKLLRTLSLACSIAPSVACLGCSSSAQGAGPGAATQAEVPDFTLESVDGRTIALSSYVGHSVVLIDFWATWCEPCLAEMPHLNELYEHNKDRGLVVLGVAMDGPDTVADVRAYVQRNRLGFPVLLDQESRAVSLYNPKRAAPFSVLIGRDGRIIKKRDGYVPGDERAMAADIAAALAGN